jgi:hypothetical protein
MDYSGEDFFIYTVSDGRGGFATANVKVTILDKTAPITTLTIEGPHNDFDPTYVSTSTYFILNAEDNLLGSGVERIEYRIDSGDWITYNDIPLNFGYKGSYVIHYRSIDKAGNQEAERSLWVVVNAVKLTYIGEIHGSYSDPVFFKAKLIDMATQLSIPGKIIEFNIGSQTVFNATNSIGITSFTVILDQPAGSSTVYASFEGDDDYLASSDSSDFTIEKECTYAIYTGSTVVPTTVESFTLTTGEISIGSMLSSQFTKYRWILSIHFMF